ncbi:MAG: solute carrier family 23 protein [Eggerthellaceae bacterium]|nr:solute carrier family 23 protein [Eggerthellaceae bacterium]
MALMKRAYGGVQPCIKLGLLRIRIPFIHFKISPPEIVTGLMNACTSYGALAVLISTLGLDPTVAWALVVFETSMYTLNWLLGEPSICGWITPAMAIMIVFLETLEPGVARIQAMTAIELELGILFLVLGFTGLSKKLNTLVPPGLKAGIVLGAGVNAVVVRLKVGGPIDTVTWGCLAGLLVVFTLMFSQRVRKHMESSRVIQILGNYSFLWAVFALFIVGGIAGEFDFNFSGEIFRAPDFGALFVTVSPFFIGWAEPSMWLMAAPYALTAWIIAYGDFVTVQQLGLQATRDDEYIEFDPNRTNVICGFRNVLLALFAPYPALAGPLSAPYCVATYQRYKQSGRQGMDSIYDGSGTNLIFTVIGLFVYPLYEASLAASAALLVVVLLIQGYVCALIAFDLVRDDLDKGMTGMMAGFIIARGAAQGLGASIALYLLLSDNDKIREDYAYNKEKQRIEDEETERQLQALHERMEAFKRGEAVED